MNCDLPPQSGRSTVKWKTPIWGSAIIRSSDDNGINHTAFRTLNGKHIANRLIENALLVVLIKDDWLTQGVGRAVLFRRSCHKDAHQVSINVITWLLWYTFSWLTTAAFVVSRTFFRQPEPDRISQRLRPVAVSRVRNISLSITTHCYSPAN